MCWKDLDRASHAQRNKPVTDDKRPPQTLKVRSFVSSFSRASIVKVCVDKASLLDRQSKPSGIAEAVRAGALIRQQSQCLSDA